MQIMGAPSTSSSSPQELGSECFAAMTRVSSMVS
jgi:hypothetical protein